MTSVNVTTQTNTVTVQQGDATTVTIATQGPQGPAGVGSSDVVDDTSPQLGGDLQSNGNDINFADNDKAIFGTGSDLQIFHDSANSYIKDNGTGQLRLQTNELLVINPALDENILKASADGAVALYHDNVKKIETSADGVDVTGAVKASTGILFGSDTAAANTLDDYEEGTWTPTVLSEGNIGTSQYTCTYTKIGRLVTINADIHQLSDTTSSSHILIGGMPYVPSGTTGNWSAVCHGERYGGSDTIVVFLQYTSGSWKLSFRFGVPSGHYSNVRHSDISDTGTDNNLRFTLTYEIT